MFAYFDRLFNGTRDVRTDSAGSGSLQPRLTLVKPLVPRVQGLPGAPALYPPQQALVEQVLNSTLGPLRYFLNADTGCGKTPMCIETMRARGISGKVLIVCPAMVRLHWAQQLSIWAPELLTAGIIEMGRKRSGLSGPAQERLNAAYAAQIQIVSFDLIGQVDPENWNWIIFDEAHHLSSPRSRQSQLADVLMLKNPQANVLGLTATMASTHPYQIWNLLRLFNPSKWGKPTKSGAPNWYFCAKYMEKVTTEYGTTFTGVAKRRIHELTAEIAQVAGRLTREDLGDFLPEFDLAVFQTPKGSPLETAKLWRRDLVGADSQKLAVFCYYRETARELAEGLKADLMITGEELPATRNQMLEDFRNAKGPGLLVCTMGSVKEGISLTWLDEYISVEWISSPGQMLQFLGRFSRLDQNGKKSPIGRFSISSDPEDQNRAHVLLGRIEALNKLTRGGANAKKLEALFGTPMDEDTFQSSLDSLVLNFIDSEEESEEMT